MIAIPYIIFHEEIDLISLKRLRDNAESKRGKGWRVNKETTKIIAQNMLMIMKMMMIETRNVVALPSQLLRADPIPFSNNSSSSFLRQIATLNIESSRVSDEEIFLWNFPHDSLYVFLQHRPETIYDDNSSSHSHSFIHSALAARAMNHLTSASAARLHQPWTFIIEKWKKS